MAQTLVAAVLDESKSRVSSQLAEHIHDKAAVTSEAIKIMTDVSRVAD